MESAPTPTLTPEEDRVFRDAYARWLPHAEALLAGDLDSGAEDGDAAYRDFLDDDDDQPSAGSIKDRILDLLADGPMALRDVRKRMPDVAPGSINNVMGDLHQAGHVEPAGSRGTYQLVN
jgi:hypothetical protein